MGGVSRLETAISNSGRSAAPESVVYVIDDDAAVCESVSWLLVSIGITPEVFHRADVFLEAYDGSHPACLVLDMRMPRMSGSQLQAELNLRAPHAVVIFVSAHGDIKMSVSAMQEGALHFLEKPYEPQQLLDLVQEGVVVAKERFLEHQVRQDVQDRVDSLTAREKEILRLVIEGLPSQNIARKLGMSVKTVDVHRTRIKSKTAAGSINTLTRDILRYDATV